MEGSLDSPRLVTAALCGHSDTAALARPCIKAKIQEAAACYSLHSSQGQAMASEQKVSADAWGCNVHPGWLSASPSVLTDTAIAVSVSTSRPVSMMAPNVSH